MHIRLTAASDRRAARLVSIAAVSLAGLGLQAASAETLSDKLAAPTYFDTPAQPLGTALKQLAKQAGIQILYQETAVQGILAPALKTRTSALEALNLLLIDTGLEFAAQGETIAVRRKADASPTQPSSSNETRSATPIRLAQAAPVGTESLDSEVTEVLVTGTRLEETLPMELAAYGNRVQVIESDTIERLGMIDVTQVMSSLGKSLVIVSRGGAFDYSEVSLLGSRTVDVLWLVDGVRISNRLYNDLTQLDTIPAHMIERVEVLEGGQSLFYGTMAVGGVVNIVTKSFQEETSGAISVGADNRDARSFSGHVRGSFTGGHKYVVYASSDESEGNLPYRLEDYEPSGTDRKRGYDYQVIGLKYSYDFSDAARLSFGYQHADGKQDYNYPYYSSEIYNTRKQDFASLKFDYDVNEHFAFYLKGYYHKWLSHYTHIAPSPTTPASMDVIYYDLPWWFKDYGFNALAKLSFDNGFEYHLGYDLQNYSGEDQVIRIDHLTETVHAVFGQVRTTPDLFDKVRLSAGVRVNMPEGGSKQSIWNASGQYDITNSLYLRASAGTSFRLPSAFELFAVDPCCRGNPNLEAEKSKSYNLSMGTSFGRDARSSIEAVGFYREVDNLIFFVDNPTLGVLEFANTQDTVEFSGVQLNAHFGITESLSANATYMYTESRNPDTDEQIDHVPRDTAKLGLEYVPEQHRYGGALTANYFGEAFMAVSSFGRQAYGDYATLDMSAFFDLDPERKHRVTLRLLNVFDTEQVTRLRRGFRDADGSPYLAHYIGPPRTLGAKYTYRF